MADERMKRSVSLLGNRAVEEGLEQELAVLFPPDRFPVDLNIVGFGGSFVGSRSMALAAQITVSDPNSSGEESCDIEFPRGRANKAVILAAVTNLLMPFEKANAPNPGHV